MNKMWSSCSGRNAIHHSDGLGLLELTTANGAMVFADPPDNIGKPYLGFYDKLSPSDYSEFIKSLVTKCCEFVKRNEGTAWISFNAKYILDVYGCAALRDDTLAVKQLIWYYTFGQHCNTDCGPSYRPMLRISMLGHKWNVSDIRIKSARQLLGDKRANPIGRVPGDVWGGPADIPGLCRIQGNNKERRAWHPTQHPIKLVERAILMSTSQGDRVIDPFMGTGTTLRAAMNLGRPCITADLSLDYCEKVSKELNFIER